MNINRRMMQEADALSLTVEELEALKKDAVDLEEAERRSMELWELKCVKAAAQKNPSRRRE